MGSSWWDRHGPWVLMVLVVMAGGLVLVFM